MQEFQLKWRKNTPSNPRHKTPTNHEKARGLKDPYDSLKSKETHTQSKAIPLRPIRMRRSASHGSKGAQCQLIDHGPQGPLTSVPTKDGYPGSAEPVIQPNQFWRHRLTSCTWRLPIGSQCRFHVSPPRLPAEEPLGHIYKYEGRGSYTNTQHTQPFTFIHEL
jgi:hypothetical protein